MKKEFLCTPDNCCDDHLKNLLSSLEEASWPDCPYRARVQGLPYCRRFVSPKKSYPLFDYPPYREIIEKEMVDIDHDENQKAASPAVAERAELKPEDREPHNPDTDNRNTSYFNRFSRLIKKVFRR